MIADFESRLALVLGDRLPPPFRGRAQVDPGDGVTVEPRVLVAVREAHAIEAGLGDARRAVVPGDDRPRRVLRARCGVRITCTAGPGQGLAEALAGVEAAAYALDAPDLRDGSALRDAGDQGFEIDELRMIDALAPSVAGTADSPPCARLEARGVFWPRATPGVAGLVIASVRMRGVTLPLTIDPAEPRLTAGGAPVTFDVGIDLPGGTTLPFGSIAVAITGPGAQPARGTLDGGAPGTDGVRLVTLVGGTARVTYAPPAAPAIEWLVIALDDGAGGAGIELGRFRLPVRAP